MIFGGARYEFLLESYRIKKELIEIFHSHNLPIQFRSFVLVSLMYSPEGTIRDMISLKQ